MRRLNFKFIWVTALVLAMIWCGGCTTQASMRPETTYTQQGKASYYARRLNGQRTASGERHNKEALTAAHPDLAFGTILQVVNLKNGRCVQVRVNDRGPFRRGRILDLSYAAAKQLGMVRDGVAKVRITRVR